MEVMINSLKINYIVEGEGQNVLLLHGWGGCIDSWYPITQHLKQKYKVWVLDLPGFGKSDLPKNSFSLSDYGITINNFIDKFEINNPIVIGHSFGGSVLCFFANMFPSSLSKMILVDSSGIRIRSFKKVALKTTSDVARKILNKYIIKHYTLGIMRVLRNLVNEKDYLNSGNLKDIYLNILKEDVRPILSTISCPVLLIWGDKDKPTPISHANIFKDMIPNSKLVIFKNAGHFSYLEYPEKFCEEVINFIENK